MPSAASQTTVDVRAPSTSVAAPSQAAQASNWIPRQIGSDWMGKAEAQAAAEHLADGPPIALPTSETPFTSPNHARIHIMAYAIQNQFTVYSSSSNTARTARMCCYRSQNDWVGRKDGDCRWQISVKFGKDGEMDPKGFIMRDEHSHLLDWCMRPRYSPLKKPPGTKGGPAAATGRGTVRRDVNSDSDVSEDSEEDDSNNSDSDRNEHLGQDLVASKVTNSQQPVPRKQRTTIGNGLKLLAHQLIQSGSPLTPVIDCRGVTQEEIQVKLIARGFTDGFTLNRHHTGNIALDLRCGRQRPERCKYKVFVVYDSGAGMWIVDRIANEHNHDSDLTGISAAVMGVARRLSGDGVAGEGDVVVGQNRGGEASVGRSVSRLTALERPALIVKSGGVSAGQKRAREEENVAGSGSNYSPRVVNTQGSNVAGPMLPPPKRSSQTTNASASGSGSKGTVATQYSVGSSSERRLPPSSSTSTSTIAPRPSNSIPTAPRPWPVELARLVTVMNKALLPKSHVFAAIFIKAGVVNRHEFSKLIWTFAAPSMQDQRMQWFIRRLRRERNGVALLTHVEVVQFRAGVKRVYDEIIPKEEAK